MSWNVGLNQDTPAYEFASSTASVVRVMAGPGTGKSFAMRRRVARLLEEGVEPERILAVTFTRTAAADLRSEINNLNLEGAENVHAATLHSLCFKILGSRDFFNRFERVPRLLLDHEKKGMLYDLDNESFGGIRDKKKRVRAFESAWARLQTDDPGYTVDPIDHEFERNMQTWLKHHNSMLMGEIIPMTLKYLQANPESEVCNAYDHILVDEYQDLNKAEQELIAMLKGDADLSVVGDDDQSIYSFKHAHPEGIRELPERYDGMDDIAFDVCRRCPETVVRMASSLINNNANRTLGELHPFVGNDAGECKILQWRSLEEQIEGIISIVAYYLDNRGIEPKDVLILTPRRKIGYMIKEGLENIGVNIRSSFREEAIDNDNARYSFSLLNYLANRDDRASLRYLLGVPSQDLRKNQYKKLETEAFDLELTIEQVLDQVISEEIRITRITQIRDRYIELKNEVVEMIEILCNNREEFIDRLVPDTEETRELREIVLSSLEEVDIDPDQENYLEWLRKLYTIVLREVSMPEVPSEVDYARVMSLHASKGLSSKFVLVTDCNEGLIPMIDPSLTRQEKEKVLEEQRRLFYVAITRCKNEPGNYPGTLILSSCTSMNMQDVYRMNFKPMPRSSGAFCELEASRFINELGANSPRSMRGRDYLSSL